jgi:hypothetical protein
VARWDSFNILCIDHDPQLRSWRVWRAYRVRLRRVWGIRDDYRRAVEARRVKTAYRAVRTRALRRRMLADLAVQPGWLWRAFTHPQVVAMADAALPPLPPHDKDLGLIEVCDRRALIRDAAALRLERAQSGVPPWPPTRLGRARAQARHRRRGRGRDPTPG